MTFLHKSIGEEEDSFGSDLKDLRELHRLNIADIARETKIDPDILYAFEEERLDFFDDPVFSEKHLIAYVRHLGGYEPYFKARYRTHIRKLKRERKTEDILPRVKRIRMHELFVGPQLVAVIGLVLFAVLLGSYVIWQAMHVNTPPFLEISSPVDGQHLERPRVQIEGQTIPEAYVTVNGQDAPVDQSGQFSISMDVRRGTSILVIRALRRRGSETVIERRVIFDQPILDPTGLLESKAQEGSEEAALPEGVNSTSTTSTE